MNKKYIYMIFSIIIVGIIVFLVVDFKTQKNSIIGEYYNADNEKNNKKINTPKFAGVIEKIDSKYYNDTVFNECNNMKFNECAKNYHFSLNLTGNFLEKINVLSTKTFHKEFDDCIGNAIYTCYSETLRQKTDSGEINTCYDYPDQTSIDNCLSQTIPKEAISKGDENICKKLKVDYLIDDCKNNFYMQTGLCDKIQNEAQKNNCNDNKMLTNILKIEDCKKILSDEMRGKCERDFYTLKALKEKNIELCNNYKDQNKNFCLSEFIGKIVISNAKNISDCNNINTYEKYFMDKKDFNIIVNSCKLKFGAKSISDMNFEKNQTTPEYITGSTYFTGGVINDN